MNQKVLVIWTFLPIPTVVILIPVRGFILIYYGYLFPKMRIIKVEIFFDYLSCITHVILSSCDCSFHTKMKLNGFFPSWTDSYYFVSPFWSIINSWSIFTCFKDLQGSLAVNTSLKICYYYYVYYDSFWEKL